MWKFIFFYFNYLLSSFSCTYSQRLIVEKQIRLCNTSNATKNQDSGSITSHRHHSPILISYMNIIWFFFNKQVIFSETKSQTTYWYINHFYYNIPLLPKPLLGPLFNNKRFYQLRSIIMKQTPYIQILYHIYIFIYNVPKTNKHILSIQQLLFIHSHRRQKCTQYIINTETSQINYRSTPDIEN